MCGVLPHVRAVSDPVVHGHRDRGRRGRRRRRVNDGRNGRRRWRGRGGCGRRRPGRGRLRGRCGLRGRRREGRLRLGDQLVDEVIAAPRGADLLLDGNLSGEDEATPAGVRSTGTRRDEEPASVGWGAAGNGPAVDPALHLHQGAVRQGVDDAAAVGLAGCRRTGAGTQVDRAAAVVRADHAVTRGPRHLRGRTGSFRVTRALAPAIAGGNQVSDKCCHQDEGDDKPGTYAPARRIVRQGQLLCWSAEPQTAEPSHVPLSLARPAC
ncbi:hypothetical protein DMT42_34245 [Streptomyces actuosus]|uniref:Uncharacterized protein n=1 Tax=Streptomyces actuosus TaxID=1885 RepID=A0A2U9PBE6_STRAS|nr:hypothetical protein DMT42_34245 [Streptomyces actuosus]